MILRCRLSFDLMRIALKFPTILRVSLAPNW
ncbi:unnamed protein product, partial [Linum tenue]